MVAHNIRPTLVLSDPNCHNRFNTVNLYQGSEMKIINRRVVLVNRPKGYPELSDFKLVEVPIKDPGPGEALVQARYLSLDPYMRGRMNDSRSYVPPLAIGEVIVGAIVGEVIRTNTDAFAVGDIVEGRLGWQEYAMARPDTVRKIPFPDIPETTALGILGMPGLTAYFSLLEIGRPIAGDTVVISAASGAVGAIVGQIAKLTGCHVIGIAGSDDKISYIKDELQFDAAINHRATEDIGAALDEACPDRVNIYFDNVGGPITDAVIPRLALRGRVVICGQISQYNLEEQTMAPSVLRHLLINQASMEGFIVTSFSAKFEEGRARLAQSRRHYGWDRERTRTIH
jgi:NADPH-dependent curcumin reductase CurA